MQTPSFDRILTLLVILLCVGLAGCPTTPHPNNPSEHLISNSPLLKELVPVEVLIAGGDFKQAHLNLDALALLHPNDPNLQAIQLLKGRAYLGQEASDSALAAFRAVVALGAPPLILEAAQQYQVLAALREGDIKTALHRLKAHRTPSISRWFSSQDAAVFWWAIAEKHAEDNEHSAVLHALGEGYSIGDEHFKLWLVERAFAFSATLQLEVLEQAWTLRENELYAASVGFALLKQRLLHEERDELTELFAECSPALSAIGEELRIEELSRLQAKAGGGRMLVGAILPLTGRRRRIGRSTLAGLLQAQGSFSPANAMQVTLVLQDSASDPVRAAEAVKKLDEFGVSVIMGPLGVETSKAAAKESELRGIPMISLSVDRSVTLEGEHVFRFGVDIDAEIKSLLNYALGMGQDKILIIHPESGFGEEVAGRFLRQAEVQGGSVVGVLSYPQNSNDLRKVAKRAAKMDFNVLFIPDSPDGATRVAGFLAQQNIWSRPSPEFVAPPRDTRRFVTILGPSAWQRRDLFAVIDRYLEGAVFTVPYSSDEPGRLNQRFVERFVSLYGRSPEVHEALAFDLMKTLRFLLLEQDKSSREQVNEGLRTLDGHEGTTGHFDFIDQRSGHPELSLARIKGGRLELFQPISLPPSLPTPLLEGALSPGSLR